MSIGAIMAMTEARRRRDKRGRYMEGDDGPYMGTYNNERSEPMSHYYPGGMPPISPDMRMGSYDNMPEMRRRRDGRGRYMEGGGSPDARYHPGGTPSYVEGNEMREREKEANERKRDPHMGGWGGFVWDSMNVPREEDDDEEDDSRRMQRPGWPWGEAEPRSNVTSMHDYTQGKERKQDKRMIGFQQDHAYKGKSHLTKEEAEEWVDQMRTKDGRPGKRWTYDEIRQYAGNYGVTGEQKVIDFFVVLNLMYSDYCHVAKKLGVDSMEFYAGMAKAFMDDPDAAEGKLAKYREYIAKDEE